MDITFTRSEETSIAHNGVSMPDETSVRVIRNLHARGGDINLLAVRNVIAQAMALGFTDNAHVIVGYDSVTIYESD